MLEVSTPHNFGPRVQFLSASIATTPPQPAPAPTILVKHAPLAPNVQPILQSLVPLPAVVATAPPPPQPLVLVPAHQQHPATIAESPLDLSCHKRPEERPPAVAVAPVLDILDLPPMLIPRTGSCSSTTSSSSCASSHSVASSSASASSFCHDEERKLKRKEQNKAAAQSYRQRKKSISDMIESEHEMHMKRNVQLKAHKTKLEDQIRRMRDLLKKAIEESKKEEEEAVAAAAAATGAMSSGRHLSGDAAHSAMPTPPLEQSVWVVKDEQQQPQHGPQRQQLNQYDDEEDDFMGPSQPMRPRKNTWPMTLTGRERKKEQNKMASRRFRQRRKLEQNIHEVEAFELEGSNKKLRDRCEELESKIKLLKDLIQRADPNLGLMAQRSASAAVAATSTSTSTSTSAPTAATKTETIAEQ